MGKALKWDTPGERFYETGVDHGVLYPFENGSYSKGVAWNGLTGYTESPSGAESNKQYADNIPYLDLTSVEEFGATIECFYYPPEWKRCDGTAELLPGVYLGQQDRIPFGFSCRTKIGNDTDGDSHGYKLHILYGGKASPSEKGYSTVNESPEAITFSYEITTTPVTVAMKDKDGKPFKALSSITIDSTKIDPEKLAKLEGILYGVDADEGSSGSTGTDPRLPLPDEIFTLLSAG